MGGGRVEISPRRSSQHPVGGRRVARFPKWRSLPCSNWSSQLTLSLRSTSSTSEDCTELLKSSSPSSHAIRVSKTSKSHIHHFLPYAGSSSLPSAWTAISIILLHISSSPPAQTPDVQTNLATTAQLRKMFLHSFARSGSNLIFSPLSFSCSQSRIALIPDISISRPFQAGILANG